MDQDKAPASPMMRRIRSILPQLSNAEQRVARFALENPNEVIALSVAGLAEACGVSDATVVRACKALGCDRYQDFKVSLAVDIVTPIQAIHEEIEPGDSTKDIIGKVFNGDLYALECTMSALSSEDIERTAAILRKARRVLIFGVGASDSIGLDMQHKLMRLNINAQAFSDTHLQAIAAVNAGKDDVIFAISHSGSSTDIVDSAKIAKSNGATVISLTNIGSSPLSKVADISLFTVSNETRYRIVALSSRIAQMAIIDSIYTIIAYAYPASTEHFHQIEQALEAKKC